MRHLPIPSVLFGLVAALSAPATFAQAADAHSSHHEAAAPADAMSEGTVKKVDAKAGKITIAHGPLKNVGMPAMTMTFKAKPATLKGVKAGDAVRFVVEPSGGDYVVTTLQPKK